MRMGLCGKGTINNDEEAAEIVSAVHKLFKARNITLSVAESCTGGLISHLLTMLPGASAFFEAGIVSYSVDSKRILLGVSPQVIAKNGVVSMETAIEMAERIISLTNTDCSLSTTGNLGPDVLEGKEEGVVYIAATVRNRRTFSTEIMVSGSRMENKREASLKALTFLLDVIKGVAR